MHTDPTSQTHALLTEILNVLQDIRTLLSETEQPAAQPENRKAFGHECAQQIISHLQQQKSGLKPSAGGSVCQVSATLHPSAKDLQPDRTSDHHNRLRL